MTTRERWMIGSSIFLVAILYATQPVAAESKKPKPQARGPIVESMDGVQWGWTPKKVYQHFAGRLRETYKPEIAKAIDAMTEDRLRYEMQREIDAIKESYIEFDGTPTGYDTGFLRYEYTHRNHESMLMIKTARSDDYYFFMRNKLWKRYRALKEKVFAGTSFDQVQKSLEKRFGKGKLEKSVLPERKELTRYVEWQQAGARLRALDESDLYGLYGLVYDDPRVTAQLAKLRTAKKAATESKIGIVDQILDPGGIVPDANQDVVDQISGEQRK